MLSFTGPAGIGKSRLLTELSNRADEAGALVLRARGTELERDFAFGIARQLLEGPVSRLDSAERDELLEGAARLAGPVLGLLDPGAAPPIDPSFATLHGLYWLTANLAARQPLLLVVDDAHWADQASLRWLVHLAGRLDGVPALLAVAVRVPEPAIEEPLLDALLIAETATSITPQPLSTTSIAALAADRLGDAGVEPGFADACHRLTGGNPFLARELLAAVAAEGIPPTSQATQQLESIEPAGVSRSVLARIARLDDGCARLASALAVIGDGTRLELVARLGGLQAAEAAQRADELSEAGILGSSERLEFLHPIIAAAVRSDLPPRRREAMHREAARLLADDGASESRIALHLLSTAPGEDGWVADRLLAAAWDAFSAGALSTAADHLRRALEERPDGEPEAERARRAGALSLLGWIEALRNDEPAAISSLTEARELSSDPVQRGLIARGLSSALIAVSRYGEAYNVLDRAITELSDADADLGLRLQGEICVPGRLDREVRSRIEQRDWRFEAREGEVAGGLYFGDLALTAALMDDHAGACVAIARTALAEGRLLAEETADSPAVNTLIAALLAADEIELAGSVCEQAVAEASARGSSRGRAAARGWRAGCLLRAGRLEASEADSRAVLDVGAPVPVLEPVVLAHLLESLCEQGRVGEAEAALAGYDQQRWIDGDELLFQHFRYARAKLRLIGGDVIGALADLESQQACESRWGIVNEAGLPWRSLMAEALRVKGERDQAARWATDAFERSDRFGAPRLAALSLIALGRCRTDPGEAAESFSAAIGRAEEAGARLDQARAQIELGAAQRRAGDTDASRSNLNEGMALARSCGGAALAERAWEELVAGGARPRKILRSGVDALTASESRVARMAADGRTNKQIAEELFVTVRTVETHLRHSFQKLEISSRKELAEALSVAEPQPTP